MPFISEETALERALGVIRNMHPDLDGDVMLTPDDLLRGAGDFIKVDADGNPEGWTLGRPENPDGRHVYVGLTPDSCTRQTHRPLGRNRPTHLVNYELVDGQAAPDASSPLLASIPKPEAPRLKALLAKREGYPASSALSPHWYAWAYVDRVGNLTKTSEPVPFHAENGQSVRVPLPEEVPDGIRQVALLLAEPGTSRPGRPGPMRVQRIIDLRFYFLDTFDLSGPFRNLGDLAPSTNQTRLPSAPAPRIARESGAVAARVGRYTARIQWTDKNGEALPGALSRTVTIPMDDRYTVRDEENEIVFLSGRGEVRVWRPGNVPEGATGWRLFLYIEPTRNDAGYAAGWRRVENRLHNLGGATPWPLSVRFVDTGGWTGDEPYYAHNHHNVCVDLSEGLPRENTSGLPNPEGAPEPPVAFGTSRPDEGRLWVRVTDTVRGIESLPSDPVRIDIDSDEVVSVLFVDAHNRVANPTFVETDPDDMPLHWTVDKTGGYARVAGEELLMGTFDAVTTKTPDAAIDAVPISQVKDFRAECELYVDVPNKGAPAGSVEIVLRQINGAGATIADTVLKTIPASERGEHEFRYLNPRGARDPSTTDIAIVYRFAGASKNAAVALRYTEVRQQPHKPRRRKRRRKPTRSGRPLITPPRTIVEDPPEPPWTPDTRPIPDPDRPTSAGTVEESINFDAGIPAGLQQVATGGATISAQAAAAIAGAQGLRAQKSAGGALASAYVTKTYAPPAGFPTRHAIGKYLRNRLAVLPTNGRLRMHELGRASDASPIAWLEATTSVEIVDLTLDEEPLAPGSVSVVLDGVETLVPVNAVQEASDLTISAAPTSPGTVSVVLDGVRHTIRAGGTQQSFVVAVNNVPSTPGVVALTVNGVRRAIHVTPKVRRRRGRRTVLVANTPALIASEIAAAGWSGYDVQRVGRTITFTAQRPGPRPAPTFAPGSTRLSASIGVTDAGNAETADELAARIRATRFFGWTTSQPGVAANVVRFTAVVGGPRKDATYSPGVTGASGSFAMVTQGSVDGAATLAARIRATAFTGWTVSGSGLVARFASDAAGIRKRSAYRPNGTGAEGYTRTIQQGSNAAITAHARDADGNVERRKIMEALGTATVFNTDLQVSGAGSDRAVVSVWGSIGADPLELLARFEDTDLTDTPVGSVRIGVVSESNAASTWELHTDEVSITDRGQRFFRDHNAWGQWLPQVEAYYDETQPARPDLLLQDGRAAVLPGATCVLSAWVRADVLTPAPARPLVAYAYMAKTGQLRELGDVTNSPGLTGVTGWTEYRLPIVVPKGCHEIRLRSDAIGAGAFVIQEVVFSPGTVPLRTYRYATEGSYQSHFDTGTPDALPEFEFWTRERLAFGAITDAGEGPNTAVTVEFSSADPSPLDPSVPGPFSAPSADPRTVPDKRFLRATFNASGPGTATPYVKSGSPNAEYVLKVASSGGPNGRGKRMSTFLKADRSELPGGAAFAELKGFSRRDPNGRRRLPSGRLHDDPTLFEPVGHLPGCELLVFNDEAREHLENNWKDPYCVEIFGRHVLTILLSEQPEFERETTGVTETADGGRYAIWKAKLAPSEVISIVELPR